MDEIIKHIETKNINEIKIYLSTIPTNILLKLAEKAKDTYYNTDSPILTDSQYDVLDEILRKAGIKNVGAQIREGEGRPPKITLPFWMGSMDKITPDSSKEWGNWIQSEEATEYILSDKLDGMSCLLEYKNDKITLYTRGNGDVGSNISSLAPYIQNIPSIKEDVLINKTLYVRGELIMSKKDFLKHSKTYKNSRNMVAGLVSSKTVRTGLNDVQFIAYEKITDAETQPSPLKSIETLQTIGFKTVFFSKEESPTLESLAELFMLRKTDGEFEIDGIIVQPNLPYVRNVEKNPNYMIAFKMMIDENVVNAVVKTIEWNVSMHSLLKPVVIIDPPVDIDGVTIKRATGHNAKYIVDNSIGAGSIIKITRSKQVIPFILAVVKKSDAPLLPTGSWKWDKNKVNIISLEKGDESCIKLLAMFFKKLGIKFVSYETVKHLYDAGFDTLIKIVSASTEDLLVVPEFQFKSAKRIHDNIQEGMKQTTVPVILGACAIFGFGVGVRRTEELFEYFPNILTSYKTMDSLSIKNKIMFIKGFDELTANKIVPMIKYADKLIKKLSPYMSEKEETVKTESLQGEKIVFSGFRDKILEDTIKKAGGKVMTSISGNTTILIVSNKDELSSSKAQKAQELGTKILTKDEFKKTYKI